MVRSLALSMLIALAAPSSAQPIAQIQVQPGAMATMAVAVSSFRIVPATIRLAAGQPVRLVFTNVSGSGHDFTAPGFFARAQILSGMTNGAGKVELPGHAQAIVTLIPAKGAYRARCTHFAHSMMGMKALIVVE